MERLTFEGYFCEIAELREENERLTRRLFEPRPVPTTSTL